MANKQLILIVAAADAVLADFVLSAAQGMPYTPGQISVPLAPVRMVGTPPAPLVADERFVGDWEVAPTHLACGAVIDEDLMHLIDSESIWVVKEAHDGDADGPLYDACLQLGRFRAQIPLGYEG
ncbi:MAG: hypothetical protein ACO1SV_12200 [Fimbriimonas sp.]